MEQRETPSRGNGDITIYRTKRDDQVVDTLTLQQAVTDLAYKGPGGNSELEKRLRAGHTLENAAYIYRAEAAYQRHIKL
jgi:hypothetical protein